jgi:hypothetical protein
MYLETGVVRIRNKAAKYIPKTINFHSLLRKANQGHQYLLIWSHDLFKVNKTHMPNATLPSSHRKHTGLNREAIPVHQIYQMSHFVVCWM